MTTGVKLRKIDQLIEKFFYDGLRATNSTPVKVISSSTSFDSRYLLSCTEERSKRKRKASISALNIPSTSHVIIDSGCIKANETLEDIQKAENDKRIKMNKTLEADTFGDKKDKAISMRDKSEGDEEPKPSTSKEVTPNLINSKSSNGSIDQRSGGDPSSINNPLGPDPQHQSQQSQQPTSYVSAAAYAAAAGFGAFLNPHHQAAHQPQQQQHLSRSTMDTYPLTAHMQATENPP